jgi:signal transduction histidine kinase
VAKCLAVNNCDTIFLGNLFGSHGTSIAVADLCDRRAKHTPWHWRCTIAAYLHWTAVTRLRLRILASFGVAILVIATGWAGAGVLSVGINTREQARSRLALESLHATLQHLVRSESAVRSYLLTGDPAYLGEYVTSLRNPHPMTALRRLAAGGSQVDLANLSTELDDKRRELAEIMRRIHDGDHGGATALASDPQSRQLSQRLQEHLGVMIVHENTTRERLGEELTRALRTGRTIIFAGMLVAFALAVLINVSLMRAVREREAWQATVETQAQQLERHTASLLEHERQLGEQLLAQQRLATALRRSNEELDQFAYATSHDLKAPLRGIMNLAGWIEEDLGVQAPADVKTNLGLMRTRARRLEALIEGILAYARAGRVREKIESVDLHQLVNDVVELIAPPPGVQVIIGSSLPVLTTERVPLQQVLMNLLQNAVKHGCPDETGRVEIVAERTDGAWRIEVRDHGPGIAPEFQQRIFGVFQTLAPRDQVEGTGIGLAMVKKLVETRGGRLSVESEVGAGAIFSFTWPTMES